MHTPMVNTPITKRWRTWLWSAVGVGLLAAVLSSSAVALPSDASGNLDRTDNANMYPRLAPDACYASSSVNADGQSNFPVVFRLRRNGELVASNETTLFRANNGTIAFQPGLYELVAVNQKPDWPARVTMSLVCY
jgi:hypothetical protein